LELCHCCGFHHKEFLHRNFKAEKGCRRGIYIYDYREDNIQIRIKPTPKGTSNRPGSLVWYQEKRQLGIKKNPKEGEQKGRKGGMRGGVPNARVDGWRRGQCITFCRKCLICEGWHER